MVYIQVEILIHLREVAKEYEVVEFVEGWIAQWFCPEGIFVAHLKVVGYSNLNEIIMPQEIERNTGSPEIVITNNVNKLKNNKSKKK